MLGELNYSLEVQRYLLLMFTDVCKYSIVWDVSVRLLSNLKKPQNSELDKNLDIMTDPMMTGSFHCIGNVSYSI